MDTLKNIKSKTLHREFVNILSKIDLEDEKIYFDTSGEDGTVAVIDSISIITYDFNDQVMIMETVDNTFLDIFNSNNLSKYNIIDKNIEYGICKIDYEFESLLTSIQFDITAKEIKL